MMKVLAAAGPFFVVMVALVQEPAEFFTAFAAYIAGGLSFAWFHYLNRKEETR